MWLWLGSRWGSCGPAWTFSCWKSPNSQNWWRRQRWALSFAALGSRPIGPVSMCRLSSRSIRAAGTVIGRRLRLHSDRYQHRTNPRPSHPDSQRNLYQQNCTLFDAEHIDIGHYGCTHGKGEQLKCQWITRCMSGEEKKKHDTEPSQKYSFGKHVASAHASWLLSQLPSSNSGFGIFASR